MINITLDIKNAYMHVQQEHRGFKFCIYLNLGVFPVIILILVEKSFDGILPRF